MNKQKIYISSIAIILAFFMTACHKQQMSVKPTVRVVQPVQTIVIERFQPTAADDYKAMAQESFMRSLGATLDDNHVAAAQYLAHSTFMLKQAHR